MSSQYIVTCSEPWEQLGGGLSFPGRPQFYCQGTLHSVPFNEPNPAGLSAEDWSEYRGEIIFIFVVVFTFLALKKALFMR